MNTRRLRAIGAHIKEHPERLNMANMCGTKCCFAGFAVAMFGTPEEKKMQRATGRVYDTGVAASRILDLDFDQSRELFFGDGLHWFEPAWKNQGTKENRAKLAARRIAHFIKTEGAE